MIKNKSISEEVIISMTGGKYSIYIIIWENITYF